MEFALDGRLAPSIHLDDPPGPLYPELNMSKTSKKQRREK